MTEHPKIKERRFAVRKAERAHRRAVRALVDASSLTPKCPECRQPVPRERMLHASWPNAQCPWCKTWFREDEP